jgi:hypothetical protein
MVSWRWALVAASPLLALAGCRAIAGYHDLEYEPVSDLTCGPVALPASGQGRIRLVNAGTVGAASDFCVRASGTTDWGAPIFAGVKPSCDTGLAYATATVPFAVASGSIDVEAIAPGGVCGKGATSSATSIPVGDFEQGAAVVTVIRMGGGSSSESLVAHGEEPAAQVSGNEAQVRLVNALSGAQSINIGVVGTTALPQTIEAPALSQVVPPGAVVAPGPSAIGAVDAQGYLTLVGVGLDLGLVLGTSTSAFAAFVSGENNAAQTAFAVGDPASNAHPIRALVCSDAEAAPDVDASAGTRPILASCSLTALPTLAVDTVNASLYGANSAFEGERRPAVYAKIAARQADVMCIVEVLDQADKDGIANAAQAWFPYAYEIKTDLTTQPTDPAEADGGAPAAVTAPPCDGVSPSEVQAIYSCVAAKCSTNGAMGTLSLTDDCLVQACVLPFADLYQHGPQDDACYDCIVDYLTSWETLSYGQSQCTTVAVAPLTFNGQSSAMILSHYPLTNTAAYILPSTNQRREVLYAEVELEDAPIDFYCVHLTAPEVDTDLPYEGTYGQDVTTKLPDGGVIITNGYEQEQDLQTDRVIEYIEQRSMPTGRPTIIAGGWYSTVELEDAGTVVLGSRSPEVMQALDSRYDGGAFVRADPPAYVPMCDYCPAPQNPYNAGAPPLDEAPTFLFQFPADSTTEETLWGTENDVPITGNPYESPPPGGVGPAFEYYPREVRVVRPRAP